MSLMTTKEASPLVQDTSAAARESRTASAIATTLTHFFTIVCVKLRAAECD